MSKLRAKILVVLVAAIWIGLGSVSRAADSAPLKQSAETTPATQSPAQADGAAKPGTDRPPLGTSHSHPIMPIGPSHSPPPDISTPAPE